MSVTVRGAARHAWTGPNFLGNRDASEELSLKISEFWQARGHDVDTQVVSVPTKTGPIFVVRSDMRNGMPIGAPALEQEDGNR
jgi:hypothetical protein